jgi:hypothetical protein
MTRWLEYIALQPCVESAGLSRSWGLRIDARSDSVQIWWLCPTVALYERTVGQGPILPK